MYVYAYQRLLTCSLEACLPEIVNLFQLWCSLVGTADWREALRWPEHVCDSLWSGSWQPQSAHPRGVSCILERADEWWVVFVHIFLVGGKAIRCVLITRGI